MTDDPVAAPIDRPPKPPPSRAVMVGSVAAVAFTVFAGYQVDFRPGTFVDVWTNPLWGRFWPVDWDWVLDRNNVFDPLVETFQIAILASILGCGISLPISFLMSRLTAPNTGSYWLTKGVMSVVRAIPDLFWAVILVAAIGVGAFAGMLALVVFSLAVMTKLFSETIDGADPRPLEAAKASGSRHLPAVRAGVFPEVLPAYVAYALYVFELNIRASLVIGLVGAGGIGRVIEAQRGFFRFDRIFGIILIIFVIVLVIERVSVATRKRLI